MIWHFFDLETGRLLGRTFRGPARDLAQNTPDGAGAVQGVFDPQRERVNVTTGEVEPWEAPPADTSVRERRARLARIRALEARQGRALRELALGDDSAKERLRALDQQISTLREML